MAIQCQEVEHCKIKVQYVSDPELVKEKRIEALKNLKKTKPRIGGFRPGKANDTALKIKCRKQIEEWVKRELVSAAYDDVLFETKMKPIGFPQVLNTQLFESSFMCDMIFLKKPEFELQKYKEFDVPLPHIDVKPADLAEQMLQELRVRHGDVVPYGEGDFVATGDKVTMDFECKVNGEVFELYTKQGMLYTVGENIIPDFDMKILGMTAGETRDFDIIFTKENNVPEELFDKRAKFHVTVHMGTKNHPCPLDDSLAQKVGAKNLADLQQQAMGNVTSKLQSVRLQRLSQQVISQLLSRHNFEVPPWLLTMEAQQFVAHNKMKMEDLDDEQKKMVNDRCKDSIKLSLILDSVREAAPESIVSDKELLEHIKAKVAESGQNADEFLSRVQKSGALIGMLASLRDEATIQWILSTCNIIE